MSNARLFSLLMLAFLFIVSTNLVADTININSNTESINIFKKSKIYFDKDSQKSVADLRDIEKEFISVLNDFVNYGYMFKDTLWVKFRVKNSSDKDILKYLVLDSPNIDIINLYFYKDNKEYQYEDGIFNRQSFESELSFKFPLALQAHETITYYLELKPITHSLHFSLKIKDYKTFKNDDLHHQLILTIFFSILFIIIMSNVVIYMNTKDTIYIYYSFFIFSIFIHHLYIRGMIAYFLPSNPEIITMQAYMPVYNLSLAVIAIFMFARKFLNLYRYKKIYFVLKLFILAVFYICIFHSKENYILNYLTPVALLFAIYIGLIGLYLFVEKKEKNAKYFFFIWSLSLIGMIGTILYYIGVIPSAIPYLFEITIIIEVLLFSLVLSSQIKDLQKEKIEKNKIMLEQSKLASMGEMLQNISHQWRQPLSEINAVAMKLDADFYKKRLTQTTLEADIERIENITSHMSDTIESFNSYFKKSKQIDETSLEIVINKALNLVHSKLQGVEINLSYQENSKISINTSELIQVLLIILNNAFDALSLNNIQNKTITITTSKLENKHIIQIEDNAGGIKKENLSKIFEPYFSTKFQSNGIGIGLYMANMLAEESLMGSLSVSNTQNGARFKIVL
ncbi:GHKL domain-containing protein [Sulfurimonas aquatica]|uniref:histidine kinase n=1 Tax=Sulfurimonas aquatica TaxID=2672570 RepID=A0A975B0J3_9BACT|nr:sensor histidine kinase [Sulfurimonas aquatica]QSZ42011.1 GHKL domain-containing protein [Sulfurimonas aquatica]